MTQTIEEFIKNLQPCPDCNGHVTLIKSNSVGDRDIFACTKCLSPYTIDINPDGYAYIIIRYKDNIYTSSNRIMGNFMIHQQYQKPGYLTIFTFIKHHKFKTYTLQPFDFNPNRLPGIHEMRGDIRTITEQKIKLWMTFS